MLTHTHTHSPFLLIAPSESKMISLKIYSGVPMAFINKMQPKTPILLSFFFSFFHYTDVSY